MRIKQLPDCEKGLWYVTEHDVKGVVGLSAATKDELETMVFNAIMEIEALSWSAPKPPVEEANSDE